jgi:hypothetical protein
MAGFHEDGVTTFLPIKSPTGAGKSFDGVCAGSNRKGRH